MSLRFLEARIVDAYYSDVFVASGFSAVSTFNPNNWNIFERGDSVWLQSRDRIWATGTESQQDRFVGYFDPDFLESSPPNTRVAFTTSVITKFAPGQYDPVTQSQKLYGIFTGAFAREINVDTAIESGASAFVTPYGDLRTDLSIAPSQTWSTVQSTRPLFFGGLTDGIPGETFVTGSGIFPAGLMLTRADGVATVQLSGTDAFIWVNPLSAECVGFLGGVPPTAFPARTTTLTSPIAAEPPIAGDQFDWNLRQYVADADATFARPKGVLFTAIREELPAHTPPNDPADTYRVYVRFTDFNPFGVEAEPGQTTRVHGRIRLTSRLIAPIAPMFGLAGAQEISNLTAMNPLWDPIRGRVLQFLVNPGFTPGTPGSQTVGIFSPTPEIAIVSAPAPSRPPRTSDVVEFVSFAGGDLGEQVTGVDVAWTLDRRSTRGEALTITGGVGTTSTVANGPIDDSQPSSPQGSLRVFADGVELAEGTDFTVVLSTGVITWVTDQQGALQVTADYRHVQTGAQPPHGELLTVQSSTDGAGIARTEVRYPDDDALVGQIDRLSSAEA